METTVDSVMQTTTQWSLTRQHVARRLVVNEQFGIIWYQVGSSLVVGFAGHMQWIPCLPPLPALGQLQGMACFDCLMWHFMQAILASLFMLQPQPTQIGVDLDGDGINDVVGIDLDGDGVVDVSLSLWLLYACVSGEQRRSGVA